jgi:hypothetical protein
MPSHGNQTNVTLSKSETNNVKQAYSNSNSQYNAGLSQPVKQKTSSDDFSENHSLKVNHALIIAGITAIFLYNYQSREPPMSDFIISS